MKSNLEHQQLEIGLQREILEAQNVAVRSPFDFTTTTPPDTDDTLTNLGINYIDNSDLDFSKDAYVNSSPSGGDDAEECYGFFRQRFIKITDGELSLGSSSLLAESKPFKDFYTYPMPFFALSAGASEKALIGTLTRVDDGHATMSVDSEKDLSNAIVFFGEEYQEITDNSLKAEDHSLFAAETANDAIARWDKTAGQTELGGDGVDNFDLAIPLPFNLATRGLDLFFSVNVKLREGVDITNPVTLYAGIFDTTSGNESFLEADNFDLEVNYIGAAGTEEYECVVVGTFNNGEQVISDVVTVSNAASVLDSDNYLDWNWSNAPRILDFALYRRNTATGEVVRVFTIYNGETRFFDRNTDGEETVSSLPTAPARREYAYAESLPFIPTSEYRRVPIFFRIPPTYDQSTTTDRQVLRIGIYNDGDNSPRPVVLDRFMLSIIESAWNRSPRDLERIQATAPTATIPDGNQHPGCFVGDTPVIAKLKPNEDWGKIEIQHLTKGAFIYNGRGGDRVLELRESVSSETFEVTLSSGISFECTASERFITSPSDKLGTRFDKLNIGDNIETLIAGVAYRGKISKIKAKRHEKPIKVFTVSLERDKIFLAGDFKPRWWKNPVIWFNSWRKRHLAGAKCHNRKANDYEIL